MASLKCPLRHHTSTLKHIPAVPPWEEPHRRWWAAVARDIVKPPGSGPPESLLLLFFVVDELHLRIGLSRTRALEASASERTPYIIFLLRCLPT